MNMKVLIVVLFCVTSSHGINYEFLKPCTNNQGVMCDGVCLTGNLWCNDLTPQYCADSDVTTNDLELCANDERWKEITCSLTGSRGELYQGERCTATGCVGGTRNYCFYPQGLSPGPIPTTCECLSSQSQSISYDALKLEPCLHPEGAGMKCDGKCLPSPYWCNDKFRKRCPDLLGVMTNDPVLCSQDERWKDLTCDIDLGTGGRYPGERCTNCTIGRLYNS